MFVVVAAASVVVVRVYLHSLLKFEMVAGRKLRPQPFGFVTCAWPVYRQRRRRQSAKIVLMTAMVKWPASKWISGQPDLFINQTFLSINFNRCFLLAGAANKKTQNEHIGLVIAAKLQRAASDCQLGQ